MKITVTGSLGYVSTPLIKELTKKGHTVIVISSKAERKNSIEAMGATAAIGSMDDANFLTKAFTGADAVYCMLAPYVSFTDPDNSAEIILKHADEIAHNYKQAIRHSGVNRVVYLSSVGAHWSEDNGLIKIHYQAEQTFSQLPADVSISFMRPVGFHKNLFAYIPAIKHQGFIAASYGGNDRNILVSDLDMADAIVDELESQEKGRKVRYIASEELPCNEAAGILGAAIGMPDLQWLTMADEQQLGIYQSFGMNDSLAAEFVEMNRSIHNGKLYKDYDSHKPTLGKVKLADFATQFAAAYQRQ